MAKIASSLSVSIPESTNATLSTEFFPEDSDNDEGLSKFSTNCDPGFSDDSDNEEEHEITMSPCYSPPAAQLAPATGVADTLGECCTTQTTDPQKVNSLAPAACPTSPSRPPVALRRNSTLEVPEPQMKRLLSSDTLDLHTNTQRHGMHTYNSNVQTKILLNGILNGTPKAKLPLDLNAETQMAIEEAPIHTEHAAAAAKIDQCVQRRHRYMRDESAGKEAALHAQHRLPLSAKVPYLPFEASALTPEGAKPAPFPAKSAHKLSFANGVFSVRLEDGRSLEAPISCSEFYDDMRRTMKVVLDPPTGSLCHQRLKLIEAKFQMYKLLNQDKETAITRINPHRDFYNVRKVDTHIHHSACMHQKHLLRFIKKKLKTEPDRIVIFRDAKDMTLAQVFESLQMSSYDLSLDMLDVHADNTIHHRFDRFNLKYNPCGSSRLREIFLKTDNKLEGLYLAQITQELFDDYAEGKYQMAELRLSIYGRNKLEWLQLSRWICRNRLFSDNNRWMIQVPRLYHIHRKNVVGLKTVADFFANIFEPLFAATLDPESHPEIHLFLQQVVAFDSVDDESLGERKIWKDPPRCDSWTSDENPPYSYYIYYMWANLNVLNKLRRERGFNTFALRPHSGEAGELDHMVTTFLLAEAVNHGITMRASSTLQYLHYIEQIGLALSPMSNNALFLAYERSPFDLFFKRGLNVSLSTDDPLQFHMTKEPLLEEYGMAKQMWKYSCVDLCEIARNSVLQSGFEDCIKQHWLGSNYNLPGVPGNDITRTNVPDIRIHFRHQTLQDERAFIAKCADAYHKGMVHTTTSPSVKKSS